MLPEKHVSELDHVVEIIRVRGTNLFDNLLSDDCET